MTGAVNYMKASDAVTLFLHGMVFACRQEKAITVLPSSIRSTARAGVVSAPSAGMGKRAEFGP